MAGSTYSSNLKIELMSTGENSGTWGDITNTNLGTALEQAIVGYGNPDYVSDANLTISITNSNAAQAARALVLNVTSVFGSLTATRELVVPTIQKQYIVQNNTTGGQSITVKTSAGTGITVPNGRKAHLYVDGTNVIQMFDFVDINGGTIDGTAIGGSSAAAGAFTTLNASGATTLDGNVTLGNASGDTVTVTGTIASNLLFTDNTYDIGASGATRPRNLYLAGAATIGGNLSVGGTLTLTGGLTLNGNVTVGDSASDTLTINSTITSNLIFTDNTYDIGASGATRPRNLFLAGNATIGGNETLTGSLTVDSTTDSSSTTTGSIQTDGGLGVAKSVVIGNNLTVDGTTFYVDSANNRVGVGTITPGYPFSVVTSAAVAAALYSSATGTSAYTTIRFDQADTTAYGFVGLGGSAAANTGLRNTMYFGSSSANSVALVTSDVVKFRIDSSQHAILSNDNLTASPWSASQTSLELGYTYPSLGLMSNGSGALFVNNLYFDGTNWKYAKNSDYGAIFNANDNSVGAFGWYTVVQGGGSAKDTTATLVKQMSLGQNGLLTLGDTTYAWASSVAGIDLRNYGGLSSDSSYAYLSSNIYYDGANKRKTSGGVGLLGVGNGGGGYAMLFQYAGSSTANSTISFSTAFAVDTSGNFGIKTTSMGAPLAFQDAAGDKIQFNAANANQYKISLQSGGGSTDAIFRFNAGTSGEAGSGAGDFQFYTGPTQKFGINSAGAVCIGPTLAAWGSSIGVLEFSGASRNQGYIAFTGASNPKGYIYSNLYYDGTNNRYVNNGSASVYEIDTTYYQWWFVGSGTAGDTASLVGKARLNASGYLGLNGMLNPRVPLQLGNSSGQMLAVYDDGGTYATRLGLGIDLTGFSYELASYIGSSAGPDGKWTFSNWNSTSDTYTRVATICQNGIGLSTENPTSGVGIKFPASQSASSNGNTLDDYEEGDWTPRLSGTSGGEYTPSGINQGRYVKIGRLVFVTCQLQWSAVVSAYSGNLIVSGLPFTNNTTRAIGSMGAVSTGLNFTSGYGEWNFLIDPGYTYAYIIQSGTSGSGYSHTPTVASSGLVYSLSLTYEANN